MKARNDEWLLDQLNETLRLREAFGIKPKKYHRIVWDEFGRVVEYQLEPDGPVYVRKRGAEGVTDTIKEDKRKRR